MNDTEILNWLEKQTGVALVNDDNGHWCVVFNGTQNVPLGAGSTDILTTFFIEKKQWRKSIREAVKSAVKEYDR